MPNNAGDTGCYRRSDKLSMTERKCEHGISFDDPCEDCDGPISCGACNGTGEGQFDSQLCFECGGKGIEKCE